MPLLYQSRQDKRSSRESLDCAMALQCLVNMGVNEIFGYNYGAFVLELTDDTNVGVVLGKTTDANEKHKAFLNHLPTCH